MWNKMTRYAGFTLCLLLLVALLSGQAIQARSASEAGDGEIAAALPSLITSTARTTAIPQAATVTVELCAKTGTVTMPDAAVVDIWGYALKPSGVPCSDSSVVAGLPGPIIEANVGDTLNITLYNELSETSSLVFPGQAGAPDLTGVTGGSSTTYSLVTNDPGTFLYESGVNTERQVPMGLYGALIVHAAPGTAYGTAASAYDAAAVLVLSELDPAFNSNPGGFDLLDYSPKYWLINGQAFPDTVNIGANTNDRVLLRYVNAGLIHHSMSLLGLYQTVVGKDGYAEAFPYELMVPSIPSGQTLDTIATVPNGTIGQQYPLYNRHMALTNVTSFPGGMMTYLEITGTGGPSNVPPLVNAGGDQVVTMPAAAALDGTVTDDGFVAPYTVLWTASGPGTVTFGNAAAEDTTASFSVAGSYLLTLTANDGQYAVGDNVTITVNPAPTNEMHVGGMSGFRLVFLRSVTITIHNSTHAPLSGVQVSGSWSGGAGGSSSCTTNASGQCTVTRFTTLAGSPSYTVNNLIRSSWTYSSASNHPNPPTITP
ncbi:MAG: multicopper oxidase domain-containing protein [Chloroflexi bacterium]|nr:multicopper oxidase domain-containing protein [Chloroflexota bacterium]MBP8057794.1 multicopper oxidase domain-containing protein [Chloroflexota bacterium]